MYSTKKNIQQLVELMHQHHVTDVVISPGSRNMPLAHTFAAHPAFHCYGVTDERSAGFQAIGLAISLNRPVAVCVTSGSALLNLCSAVSEAYYQRIPLLIISADRPESWIGQMDGQTLPQTGVFATLIRKEVTLPEPTNAEQEWFCNRLINEALLELTHRVAGPVHINVPITEPFFDCTATELPQQRVIRRNMPYQEIWNHTDRKIVIVGQLSKSEADNITPLLRQLNVPILCEHLSNLPCKEPFVWNMDLILSAEVDDYAPELVVYIGGHIVSKRLKKWLRNVQPSHCWRIDPEGECSDTFQCLTNIIEQTNECFLQTLTGSLPNDYYHQWITVSRTIANKYKDYSMHQYCSLQVVQQLMDQLPSNSSLLLANSSSVRYAQLFTKAETVEVSCNRGINGIDGSLSAAVGYAVARPQQLVFLLIGDLSFFYDMNALWCNHLPSNLRIILINNGGGEIFRVLPGLPKNQETQQFVMAEHHCTAQEWVDSIGCHYFSARSKEEAEVALQMLCRFDIGQQTLVGEFFTDPEVDEAEFKQYYQFRNK